MCTYDGEYSKYIPLGSELVNKDEIMYTDYQLVYIIYGMGSYGLTI